MTHQIISRVTLVVIAMALVAGCATKRYGRMQAVTDVEQQYFDCRDIEIELAKIAAFRQEIADAKMDGRSVAAFLGDFGIGNAMEKDDALDSAAAREKSLLSLKAEKGCALTPTNETTSSEEEE